MTDEHPITIQYKPNTSLQMWGYRIGTRKQAVESARDVLECLREQGFNKAKVFLHGKKILIKKVKETSK